MKRDALRLLEKEGRTAMGVLDLSKPAMAGTNLGGTAMAEMVGVDLGGKDIPATHLGVTAMAGMHLSAPAMAGMDLGGTTMINMKLINY